MGSIKSTLLLTSWSEEKQNDNHDSLHDKRFHECDSEQ